GRNEGEGGDPGERRGAPVYELQSLGEDLAGGRPRLRRCARLHRAHLQRRRCERVSRAAARLLRLEPAMRDLTRPLRVIQWATGAVGTHALRALIEDPLFDLVGVFVHDPAKVGRDAGELAGLSIRTGIAATDDAERLIAADADCAVYTAVGETRVRSAVT